MEPIIKLEKVNFYYDKGKPSQVHALKDSSFSIFPGEYISFFGPSGCGKSTLLYLISGVEQPDDGLVLVGGRSLGTLSPKELAIFRQVGIGIIFQNFNLIPSVKNVDNVSLPMAFLGISPEKRRERALEILDRLGVRNLADRFPYELSGGQQQRVAIARSLANDPPIILADEPIGNLDSANAENVLDLLKEFNLKDGKTIIMVTHEPWSLRDVSRVFYMRDGMITQIEERQSTAVRKTGSSYYNKKLFPELPEVEVRAKTLSSMILRGYSQAEINRLEAFLIQRFKGKITTQELEAALDQPYKEGGVGLWKGKAKKITAYVEKIIQEEKELAALYEKLEKSPEAPLHEEVERIRQWLFEDSSTKLTAFQIVRLNESISERIRNIITAEHFRKVLNLNKRVGGVGLRIKTSLRIADRLETLLGTRGKEEKGNTMRLLGT